MRFCPFSTGAFTIQYDAGSLIAGSSTDSHGSVYRFRSPRDITQITGNADFLALIPDASYPPRQTGWSWCGGCFLLEPELAAYFISRTGRGSRRKWRSNRQGSPPGGSW